jgi:hypothetical protein
VVLSEVEVALEPVDELLLEESTDEDEDVPVEVVEAHPASAPTSERPAAVTRAVRDRRIRFMDTTNQAELVES